MTTNTVNPIPDGYHSLTPYLAVPDGPKAIEFYQSVFGAEVISRQDMPDGRVGQAELKFGNSMLQLSDQMPQLKLHLLPRILEECAELFFLDGNRRMRNWVRAANNAGESG